MGKTGDLLKKNEDIKGTFYIKMGTIKNRNGKDLTETEEIKKRWREYSTKPSPNLRCAFIIYLKIINTKATAFLV